MEEQETYEVEQVAPEQESQESRPGLVKIWEGEREVMVDATEERLIEVGVELSEALGALDDLEEEKAAFTRRHKSLVGAQEKIVAECRFVIDSGKEKVERPVFVMIELDDRRALTIDQENGVEYNDYPATPDQIERARQGKLFDEPEGDVEADTDEDLDDPEDEA